MLKMTFSSYFFLALLRLRSEEKHQDNICTECTAKLKRATQHKKKKKILKEKNEPRAAPITPNQCRAFVNKNIDANQQTIWTTPGIRNIRTCHFIFSDFIVTPVVSLFLLCYKTLNLFFHCFIFSFLFQFTRMHCICCLFLSLSLDLSLKVYTDMWRSHSSFVLFKMQ